MQLRFGAAILALFASTALGAVRAGADEVVRIAYIDPLSGPLAETGQLGEQHFRFAIDRVNASHAAGPGRTFELVSMDNEVSRRNPSPFCARRWMTGSITSRRAMARRWRLR